MRIIEQSSEILEPSGYDLGSIYKDIERAARVSYKSEDRVTEDSAKPFVERLIKNGHLGCLEHGTVYLFIDYHNPTYGDLVYRYLQNHYSRVNENGKFAHITTNLRVIIEEGWETDLQYLCSPTEHHEKRVSVKFITSIAMSRELNRHRINSIIEQSTRYCNYSKDKFGNEISVIRSPYVNTHVGTDSASQVWSDAMSSAEDYYMNLLAKGWKPQEARSVLPLDTATELIHTAFIDDWYHLFELRCAPSAHPQMQALINPLKKAFNSKYSATSPE